MSDATRIALHTPTCPCCPWDRWLQLEEVLADEDHDKDGHISWGEFSGPKGVKDEL